MEKATTKNKKKTTTSTTKKFKDISTATGGKIENATKKKMGRPLSDNKSKGYSVYLFEDDVKFIVSIKGDIKKPSPNDFVKDLFSKMGEDEESALIIFKAIYGEDSKEFMIAKFEIEKRKK